MSVTVPKTYDIQGYNNLEGIILDHHQDDLHRSDYHRVLLPHGCQLSVLTQERLAALDPRITHIELLEPTDGFSMRRSDLQSWWEDDNRTPLSLMAALFGYRWDGEGWWDSDDYPYVTMVEMIVHAALANDLEQAPYRDRVLEDVREVLQSVHGYPGDPGRYVLHHEMEDGNGRGGQWCLLEHILAARGFVDHDVWGEQRFLTLKGILLTFWIDTHGAGTI